MVGIKFVIGSQFRFAVDLGQDDVAVMDLIAADFFQDGDIAVEDACRAHAGVGNFYGEEFPEIEAVFQQG
ncbi:MAG: hypothetical protein E7055_03435 [Lentisphaerae bacterium]|nr:hypothetical protein [Lentisphaerota bacterium]